MKKLLLILTVAAVFTSCGGHKTQKSFYVCNCEQRAKVASDIKESIKNANNMSDEEMEDVVAQLELTYVRTNCNQQLVDIMLYPYENGHYEFLKMDSSLTYYNY